MAKCYDTSNADGSTVGQIQDVIADKMKLADSVIGRQFKRFDGVDFIIGQTQTSDIAHIGEDARSDHTQIAFLDAQQLNNKKKKNTQKFEVLILFCFEKIGRLTWTCLRPRKTKLLRD